jgi:hypothetical protein
VGRGGREEEGGGRAALSGEESGWSVGTNQFCACREHLKVFFFFGNNEPRISLLRTDVVHFLLNNKRFFCP